MDLALAALLGLLVTNIVSFTLGARAGRQSVEPTTRLAEATVQETTPISELKQTLPAPAKAAPQQPVTPPSSGVQDTGPIVLSGTVPAPGSTKPQLPAALATAPASAAPAATQDMAGKFVVRLVAVPFSTKNKKTCEKIRAWIASRGFAPGVVRTSRGKLVVEAGRYKAYDSAVAAATRIQKLRLGYDKFDTAYVVQRSR